MLPPPIDDDSGFSRDFDEATRYQLTLTEDDFMRWLLHCDAVDFEPGNSSDARRQSFPENISRTNDLAYTFSLKSQNSVPRLAVIEIQLTPEFRMPGRMLVYCGLVSANAKPSSNRGDEFWPVPVIINLTKNGEANRDWRMPNGFGILIQPYEWNIADLVADDILAGFDRGEIPWPVLAWLPLMQNGGNARIVQEWRQRVIAMPSAKQRGELISLVMIFAGPLRRQRIWEPAVEGINVIESEQVQTWKRQGEAKGRVEGRVEGELKATRNNIVMVLQKRFGTIPESDRLSIEAITNLDRCSQLLIEAAVCPSIEAFTESLNAP